MTRDVIINKVFTRAFMGYDAAEVDNFLDEVIREFDRMKQELDVARLRNKMLLDELERYRADAAAKTESEKAEPKESEKTAENCENTETTESEAAKEEETEPKESEEQSEEPAEEQSEESE